MKIFGITGNKNSGKTHLTERLVTTMCNRGLSVSTIKHAHHDADIDQPGRDTYRHRKAGAQQVVLSTKNRLAIMTENLNRTDKTLKEIIDVMDEVDIVIVEGYKNSLHPKIETYRKKAGSDLLANSNSSIKAICSDTPLTGMKVPVFELDDTHRIVNFILKKIGLKNCH
tara:strand:- start:322 stop:828 length:507 start_codon:yes stop_codon:yes gene_type:complete